MDVAEFGVDDVDTDILASVDDTSEQSENLENDCEGPWQKLAVSGGLKAQSGFIASRRGNKKLRRYH